MMRNLNSLVRQNILDLKPYTSARDEFKGAASIYLDANENPYEDLNRYPDPYQSELKKRLSTMQSVPVENIFIGNGSDEIIDLVFRVFCNPTKDKVLSFSPTYGMYEVLANVNDVEYLSVPLNEKFQISLQELENCYADLSIKVIVVCTPNNPTANLIEQKTIENILLNFQGIVLIDEAYIDFADQSSWNKTLDKYSNLIVLQTLSKAWGAAAIRIGIAFASKEIVGLLNKVKPPYNVSELNQKAALKVLNNTAVYENNKQSILLEKARLIKELIALKAVEKVFPSDSNFVLIKVQNAMSIYEYLLTHQIVVRNRSQLIADCIRISIGKEKENNRLIEALKNYKK